jgi:catechol 2,3-dioxygenase-like lactoylglutathione lyase family enzyme
MKPKISMITLGVRDLARALSFYRDGLGFETHNYKDGDDCIMFRLESTWLALYPRELLAADTQVSANGGGFPVSPSLTT